MKGKYYEENILYITDENQYYDNIRVFNASENVELL